ncbi:MAG: PH domain-containing protein [Pirellulales bacterium]
MKQAIAGVMPAQSGEATIMMVWPSIADTSLGRLLGRLYGIRAGFSFLTVGNLVALLSIPVMLPLYAVRKLPFWVRRYRLTNRRVLIERGIQGRAEQYVDLDRFDAIDVVVLPGQEWYPAGDLVFRRGTIETFRLRGVQRPETFRQTCLKAHHAYVGVRKAMALVSA